MRLMEAIIDANHRALAGDANAGLHPAEFADDLPLVALTCIDVRLNPFFPRCSVCPRNNSSGCATPATSSPVRSSSTMRSLALACAVKGGKEIAIIGHTDCQVGKTTTMQLLEKLRAIGVERHMLPDNLTEFFGMFGSDRQNVIKAADIARQSPLIGPKIPIHGLLVDVETGKLDWLVNGYQAAESMSTRWNQFVQSAGQTVDKLKSLTDFNIGEMKFPETKIGETVTNAEDWIAQKVRALEMKPTEAPPEPEANQLPPVPPRIPLPPPIRPRLHRRPPK